LSNEFTPISLRDPNRFGSNFSDFILKQSLDNNQPQSIFLHPEYGWILGAVEYLEISGKRWGYLIVGFDADIIRGKIRNLFIYLILSSTIIIILTLIFVFFYNGTSDKKSEYYCFCYG